MGKPEKSYNDLEMVEGDMVKDNSNKQSNINYWILVLVMCVEILRIKFNAKDIANILNKYVTQVDCTKKMFN